MVCWARVMVGERIRAAVLVGEDMTNGEGDGDGCRKACSGVGTRLMVGSSGD